MTVAYGRAASSLIKKDGAEIKKTTHFFVSGFSKALHREALIVGLCRSK